jgi:acyl carrier protein
MIIRPSSTFNPPQGEPVMETPTMTPELILQGVQEVLADALGVDEDEATPDARVVNELGAESIDFLDIHFRLEKKFGIRIRQDGTFPPTGEIHLHEPMEPNVIKLLKKHFPFINWENHRNPRFEDICTVDFYCKFIAHRLEALPPVST